MPRQILITVLLSVFIALLGVGIIIPVMPVFATELGAGGLALGMIIAVFSVTRGVLQPAIGNFSDRRGRKGFLVAGLFIYGLVGLLIPQAGSVFHLLLIRGFQGVGSAMIVPIGMAYMSILAPPGREGRYQSYLNIAIFCGIGCGPVIGGIVADLFSFKSVFYLMAGLSFGAFVLVLRNMPSQHSQSSRAAAGLLKSMGLMMQSRLTLGILLARYVTMIIMVPSMAFLPLLMTRAIEATGLQIGFVIACRTLVNALLQIPAGRVADRSNKLLLLLIGCLWLSGVIMLIPFMESFVMFLITYCLLGLGEAIIWPVLGAYASIEGRRRYGHGTMMGVFSLAMSGGIMTGAMLAGFSMDVWGIEFAYFVTAGTVFIGAVGAVIMIGTGAKKESEPQEVEQTELHRAGGSLGTG
ncbi:MAG: MFS transporter [Desulfofustis sp.]|nr:MFS transporter [Desulfofustis sp.]NNK13511.1 MFS transporter [Desulfofustis sp.]